jgi:hypothetical protein
MFQFIREYFAAPDDPPPRKGRGRRVAAVFAFEFVVVVLGVLVAQLIGDWFAGRAEAQRATEALALLDQEANRFATTSEYRLRAHECEVRRLKRFGALVRAGGTLPPAELPPPIMPMPSISEWSDGTRAAVARHGDSRDLQRYDGLRLLAQMISERQRRLEDQWADFALLGSDWAGSDAGRRSDLALAVTRSEGLLGAMDMNAGLVQRLFPRFRPEQRALRQLAQMDHPCASSALTPLPRTSPQ